MTLTGTKQWNDANDQDGKRPGSITVVLSAKADGAAVDGLDGRTVTISERDDWRYAFRDLPKYQGTTENLIQYSVTEQAVPAGYQVAYAAAPAFTAETETAEQNITNTHTPEVTSVSGTKTWNDRDDQDGKRPASITVRLYHGSKEVAAQTVTPDAFGKWSYTFSDLSKYENGRAIQYSVKEDPVDGYIQTAAAGSLDLVNYHAPDTLALKVTKVWDDAENQDGIRPEAVTVELRSAGGTASCTLNEANNWTFTWLDLPMNEDGQPLSYSVLEEVPAGYTAEYQTSGYDADTSTWAWTITNHHTPETTTFTGEKAWWDISDQDGIRPDSIRVNLYGNGVLAASKNVTREQDWKFTFTDLPKYSSGQLIRYSVEEENVAGYTPAYLEKEGGASIINVHIPAEVNVKVKKVWEDGNDVEGFRPDSVTVALLQNGSVLRTQELNAENGWTHTFEYLDQRQDGAEISYSILEYEVDGYTTEYTVEAFDEETLTWTWTITNRHEPRYIDYSGEKFWWDADNQDGLRPESVTVLLMKDGAEVARQVLRADAEGNWKYSFAHLPEYENGEKIRYYVDEESVSGYLDVTLGETILNYHAPQEVNIQVTKVWDDYDNQEGIRPEKVEVGLRINGGNAGYCELSGENNWTHTWEHFPMYENGVPISVNLMEASVPGYTTEYQNQGYDQETKTWRWVVTNRHTQETVDISGRKTWLDNDNQDGFRPASIRVYLYSGPDNDRTELDSRVVSEATGWKYTFENLPRYSEGEEIRYTVDEGPVDGYINLVQGYDLVNIRRPETVNIRAEKEWDDEENAEGLRPEQLTVILYKNGEALETRILSEENGWSALFENLPARENGKGITYDVGEENVKDYTMSWTPAAYEEEKNVWVWKLKNQHVPDKADYMVEFYYQQDGKYPDQPNSTETRSGILGLEARVTDADMQDGPGRYSLDSAANNILSGIVQADGSLRLKLYFRPYYIITYDPNQGILDGGTDPVNFIYYYGDQIAIYRAPSRSGYIFDYWRGSEYQPGDAYTVTEDHTFVAQWKLDNPRSYKFSFTKKWSGGYEDSIDWTLYHADGTVASKLFNKKIVSESEWSYETWFDTGEEYYLIEKVPAGYTVKYENVGKYAGITDRCYRGGTIINYRVPQTGDSGHPILWTALVLSGLGGLFLLIRGRQHRRNLHKS